MNLLTWLNPGRWLLLLAAVAALILGYFAWADHIGDVREEKVRAEYAKQVEKVNTKREEVTAPIALKFAKRADRIVTVTKETIKEVPVYVSANDCPMSPGFRVFHDAAANGEIPDPARIADAAAVPPQDAAATLVANYGNCHAIAARLTGLQEWIRAQQVVK